MSWPRTHPSEVFTTRVGGGKGAKRETEAGALPAARGDSFQKKRGSAAADDGEGSRGKRAGKGFGIDL